MAETVHKGQPSGIRVAVDNLVRQAEIDKFQLNETKCKELQITFSKSVHPFIGLNENFYNRPKTVGDHGNMLLFYMSMQAKKFKVIFDKHRGEALYELSTATLGS